MAMVSSRFSALYSTSRTYQGLVTPRAAANSWFVMIALRFHGGRGPSASHDAAVLAAVKNKPYGWPLKKRPFLTATARGGSASPQAGTKGWSTAEQRDATGRRHNPAYPFKIQKRLFFSMDRMVGKDFEAG